MKKIFMLILITQLIACSRGIEGTYSDSMGISKYEFKKNGIVIITSFGSMVETEYEIDGDKLKINGPKGTLVLTILENGAIKGPLGLSLKNIQN